MTTLRNCSPALILLAAMLPLACGGGGSAGTTAKNGSGTVNIDPPPHQGGSGGSGGGTQDEIAQMRTVWESRGFANYDFVLQQHSFSPQNLVDPVLILVRGGQVTSRTYVSTGLPATPPGPDWWPTMDGLFDFLRAAKDANPDQFQVTWDAARGFPTYAFVDYVSGMADEERGFTVSNFAPR
jgi:hypothetical protein